MKIKILLVTLLGVMLVGCSIVSEEKTDGSKIDETSDRFEVENYTDPETGVCYLIFDEIHAYGSSGGITVRYNADGSIMVKGDLK